MSDETVIAKIPRGKYDKAKDAPRMKAYMALVRMKNKAGYFNLTVKQWQAQGCPGSALADNIQPSAA